MPGEGFSHFPPGGGAAGGKRKGGHHFAGLVTFRSFRKKCFESVKTFFEKPKCQQQQKKKYPPPMKKKNENCDAANFFLSR